MSSAAIVTIVGCGGGGGGGGGSSGTVTPEVTTADVSTRVIDGAISNALVCMDKNRNGDCDAGEPQGRTDASGNLTLKVDKADVGKFPLLTLVGTDAVDADHGPVTEPFAMTMLPGKSSVISPLTTMVAQAMESGATEAEATVKGQTGITVSLFEDFVKVGKPATGQNPGDVARMVVVTTQEQNKRLQASVGTQAIDGSTISKQDLQRAVLKKVLQILPQVVVQMNNAAGAGDQKAKEAAVRAGVVASLMDANALKTEVALDIQLAKEASTAPQAYVPTAGFNLDSLNFLDTANWSIRALGNSLASALAYNPTSNNRVFNYSAAIAAGVDGRVQAPGTGCNLPEYQVGPAVVTTTLEGMVAAFGGQPCFFAQSSFVSGATTFYEGGVRDTSFTSKTFGNSTLPMGTLGTVSTGSTPTGFYTGNKLIRLAFTGTGTNPVTYYSCDQRFINGSTRNCVPIGSGSYTITTLGDARVMTFSNTPATAFPSDRIDVERNGLVYSGFKDKLTVTKVARPNLQASVALLGKLGIPAIDPETPQPLTAASYQGTWDMRRTTESFAFNVGTRLVINGTNGNNAIQCFDNTNGASMACTFSVTNPATGAFTLTSTSDGSVVTGTLDFMTGAATFTVTLTVGTPFAGVGQRR